MRFPSFTEALLDPAKLTSANLSVVFSRFANCANGGAAYSPMPYMTSASVSPARPTGQAIRQTDTPEARVTTSSLPDARLPRPISAPIIAPIGGRSTACCGRLRRGKRNASSARQHGAHGHGNQGEHERHNGRRWRELQVGKGRGSVRAEQFPGRLGVRILAPDGIRGRGNGNAVFAELDHAKVIAPRDAFVAAA